MSALSTRDILGRCITFFIIRINGNLEKQNEIQSKEDKKDQSLEINEIEIRNNKETQ